MDENLCTRFIHDLLGLSEDICSDQQKIKAVKHAWMYGHDNGLLSNDMYAFGIEMLKLENETTTDELLEVYISNAIVNLTNNSVIIRLVTLSTV